MACAAFCERVTTREHRVTRRAAAVMLADERESALAVCAEAGRFGDGDLAGILAHQAQSGTVIQFLARASQEQTLQRSTGAWEGFGR